MQRSYVLFENSCRRKATLEKYSYHLERFRKFSKIKDYDALASLDSDTVQILLEDYILYLKRSGISGASFKSYLDGIELFFESNKKFFHKKSLHRLFPEVGKAGGERPYSTKDVQILLENTTKKRTKAYIHFLASTGARPSAISDPVLRFKHITSMPFGCKAVVIYEDSKEEYWAFLTPEASTVLEEYVSERISQGEEINDESPVFRSRLGLNPEGKLVGKPISNDTAQQLVRFVMIKSGIQRIKTGRRYDKAIIYGFRKRFNTILKLNNSVNSNIAEKLMAHKRGLDGVYFKPTKEECFAEFVKAIPDLTVNEAERLKEQLRVEKEIQQKTEFEKGVRIERLENKLNNVLKLLERIDVKDSESDGF